MAAKTVASLALAVTLLADCANPVRAETAQVQSFLSGEQLLVICKSPNRTDQVRCLYDMIEATDMANLVAAQGWPSDRVCMPIIAGQSARDVIVQFLEVHPADRHYGGATLAWEELAAAWPCSPRR